MREFIFPDEVRYIFNVFLKEGDEIMLVGGCVRDFLMNKVINDYDLATKYKPDKVEAILKYNNISYFKTGIKFGTITAIINDKKIEITSLRKDTKTDGRYAEIEFVDDYFEDAKRRDFTFNALYMDYNGNIYDFFNGIEDLKNGTVKFIGNSENRIVEDNLRILRFFRFYNLCNPFSGYEALQACIKYKHLIKNLSKERISDEFMKILSVDYCVKTLKVMQYFGILQEIFGQPLDLENLEVFYSMSNFINFDFDSSFILALILSRNNNEFDFVLNRKVKKFINEILSVTINKINFFEIKKLLFKFEDKEIVKNIIILHFCNNFTNFEDLSNNLNFLERTNIPKFNIRGTDLMAAGFKNKNDFSKIIKTLKNIYVSTGFKLNKFDIIKKFKKSMEWNN